MAETKGLVKLENPAKDLELLIKNVQGSHQVPIVIVTDKSGDTAVGILGSWGGPEGEYCLTEAIKLNPGSGRLTHHAFGGNGSLYVFRVKTIANAYQVK